MTQHDFDLFVIGGGSGGVRAARVAAGYGAKVALAEEFRLGGTCVIRGCVPKKLLVYAARFRDEFEDAAGFGWSVPAPKFDWTALIAAKDKEIGRLESVYRGLLEKSGVRVFASRASLRGVGEVMLDTEGYHVRAKTILIATGARPFVPHIRGAKLAITSNEAFDLDRLPRSILIAGGGYVAIEFASIFRGLGVSVTLVYRGQKILRGFDEDLRDGLTEALGKRGVEVRTGAMISGIETTDDGYRVALDGGGTVETSLTMLATGRVPNTEGLRLERAGVDVGALGEIIVDAYSKTSSEGIYAVGDVTNRVNLTPVAIREGQAFADTVFGGVPTKVDHALIPTAVFATPEIATVGLTEEAARATHPDVGIYKTRFRPMRYTLSGRDERMLMKLVVAGDSGKVLGCHVMGPDASEMVQMAAVALGMGATKADFDATMALHPSAAEELVTLRERWSA